MVPNLLMLLDIMHKELLFFASFCFLIGSTDDLIFDGLWLLYKIRRKFFIEPEYKKATVESLNPPDPSRPMAVFVPTWNEAPVIGAMLRRCLTQWSEDHFRIYVGCYPNDQETILAVAQAGFGSDKIRLIVCREPGPTSKADCLNNLWDALCRDEIEERMRFEAVVLHDAEDIVHPNALNLLQHLVARAALVQLPVIPRRARNSRWIAGHYGDEFAEMHGKQMVLREALGAAIPSAGVGCAFARNGLSELSVRTRGRPFDANSLTEDYELGLHLTGGKERGIFARLEDPCGQLIATQEFFPDNLEDAIRQKSRWMAGIALNGWDRMGWKSSGWKNSWRENWMRLRDRKASFAAVILAIGYITIILTGLLILADLLGIYSAQPVSEIVRMMLVANLFFLLWRLGLKSYFVFSLYGMREAFLSIPRTIVANVINILAAWRAMGRYLDQLSGLPPKWEKTVHFYPPSQDVQKLRLQENSGADG